MLTLTAKDIIVRPLDSRTASAFVRRVHYSGNVVGNSQMHFGVYLGNRLEGVMQFGPSLDKRKIQGLVRDTGWNGFIELNRMAFSDNLPRNSESRALSVAFRLMRKHAPYVKWIVSFADATQCGDGTIYRASGFVLTGIKKNNQTWLLPDGSIESRASLTGNGSLLVQRRAINRINAMNGGSMIVTGAATMKPYIDAGAKPLDGFQLRYIYFLDPAYRDRLTVPVIPFSEIERQGASMYRGQKRAGIIGSDLPDVQSGEGGATPTPALQINVTSGGGNNGTRN